MAQKQARSARGESQQQAFGHVLEQHLPARRAHRDADGRFASTPPGARQQQGGGVGGGDGQHKANRTHHQVKRGPHIAHHGIAQRDCPERFPVKDRRAGLRIGWVSPQECAQAFANSCCASANSRRGAGDR